MSCMMLAAAPALGACSGVGAPFSSAQNLRTAFLGMMASCLIAGSCTILLWLIRRRSVYPALLALALAVQSLALFSSGGDCQQMAADAGQAGPVICLLLATVGLLRSKRELAQQGRSRALLAWTLLFLGGAVAAWFGPWSLRPLPSQSWYLVYPPFSEFKEAQDRISAKTGAPAKGFEVLGRGIPHLQVESTYEANNAAHVNFHHRFRLLTGSDKSGAAWAILAMPVDWPEGGHWQQYLLLPDGRVYAKPDPGDQRFLLDAIPADPVADGWVLSDYLSRH